MPYSLPLTFHNRREVFAELSNNLSAANNIIIPLADTYTVNIFTISKQQILRSLHDNGVDTKLADIEFSPSLTGSTLTVHLAAKTIVESNKTTETKKNASAYHDELDEEKAWQEINEQKKQTHIPLENAPKDLPLGTLGKYIQCTVKDNNAHFIVECTALQITEIQQFDVAKLSINFIYQNAEITFRHLSIIHFAHPQQYMGMALDFGSESSQLAVQYYDTQFGVRAKQPTIENLFEHIKNYHINNKWCDDDETTYYQEEADNNFYKSVFFLRERLSGQYSDLDTETYIKDQPNNLKMLVKVGALGELMESKHYQLPNLKISHKHADLLKRYKIKIDLAGAQYTSTLNDIQGLISSNILRTIIASMLHKDKLRYKQQTRMLRLMLLVPNIYDAEHVIKVQMQLNIILQELADVEFKDRLLAWEVLTISESDAAFIGYLNKERTTVQQNKDYSVIDVGKGTTDFSILRTGQNNVLNLQSIYRNGFAGAGNLITHAIFETVLHFIREQNYDAGAQNYIRESILAVLDGTNLGARNLFFNEIERLKFNFGSNIEAQKTQWLRASAGDYRWYNIVEKRIDTSTDFNTVTNLLKQIEQGADFYGYVQDVCEAISTKVVSHLAMVKNNKQDFACDGVLLTGRGFLFKPLQQLVIQKITTELNIPANKISILTGNELKDICIKGVFDNSVRVNAESVGHPIQIIKTGTTTNTIVNNTEESKPTNWFQKLLMNAINNDTKNHKHKFVVDNQLSFSDLNNSNIVIGSNTYKVSNSRIFDVQPNIVYKATIDYTNTGYIVRRHNGRHIDCISKLEQMIDFTNVDKQMVIPSLFPNYIVEEHIQSMTATVTPATRNINPNKPPSTDNTTPPDENPSSDSTPDTPINDLLF
jgi:hypothetical protein